MPVSRSTAVVIPCFNEAARLDVDALREYATSHVDTGFVLVDDGSGDGTGDLLAGLAAEAPEAFACVVLEQNSGKAEAVRRGVLEAIERGAKVVGYWDADLATPLDAIETLGAFFDADPALLLVVGSRVRLLGRSIRRSTARHYVGRVFATLASLVLRLPVYDTQCGAKLFRVTPETKTIWDAPFMTRWVFDVELIARLRSLPGVDAEAVIRECPLEVWHDRPGSKVRLVDGFRAGFDLLRIGWRYR